MKNSGNIHNILLLVKPSSHQLCICNKARFTQLVKSHPHQIIEARLTLDKSVHAKQVTSCQVMLSQVILSNANSMQRQVMPNNANSCQVMSRQVTPSHAKSCQVMSSHTKSCQDMPSQGAMRSEQGTTLVCVTYITIWYYSPCDWQTGRTAGWKTVGCWSPPICTLQK